MKVRSYMRVSAVSTRPFFWSTIPHASGHAALTLTTSPSPLDPTAKPHATSRASIDASSDPHHSTGTNAIALLQSLLRDMHTHMHAACGHTESRNSIVKEAPICSN